jgi:hypothetical protein
MSVAVGGVQVNTSDFNFSDHRSRVWVIRTTNATLIALVAVFVALRLAVRICLVRKVFLDDGKDLVQRGAEMLRDLQFSLRLQPHLPSALLHSVLLVR